MHKSHSLYDNLAMLLRDDDGIPHQPGAAGDANVNRSADVGSFSSSQLRAAAVMGRNEATMPAATRPSHAPHLSTGNLWQVGGAARSRVGPRWSSPGVSPAAQAGVTRSQSSRNLSLFEASGGGGGGGGGDVPVHSFGMSPVLGVPRSAGGFDFSSR